MDVKVIGVREQNTLNPAGGITKVIVLTYMVGTQGPFTLLTTQTDLNSGAANTAMQNFANTLALLPGIKS
jgi:hypothetical protein